MKRNQKETPNVPVAAHFSRKYLLDVIGPNFLKKDFVLTNATKPFKIATTYADAKRAQPVHPSLCMYGQACRRKGHPALIYRNVAYVVQNPRLVFKYVMPREAKAHLIANDMGKPVPGATITLTPPSATSRMAVGGAAGIPMKDHGKSGKKATKKDIAARIAGRERLKFGPDGQFLERAFR